MKFFRMFYALKYQNAWNYLIEEFRDQFLTNEVVNITEYSLVKVYLLYYFILLLFATEDLQPLLSRVSGFE